MEKVSILVFRIHFAHRRHMPAPYNPVVHLTFFTFCRSMSVCVSPVYEGFALSFVPLQEINLTLGNQTIKSER